MNSKTRKVSAIVLTSLLSFSIVGCNQEKNSEVTGDYSIYVEGEDWGAGVSKATLSLDKEVENVDKTDFKVLETKQTTDWSDDTYPVVKKTFKRKVTDAYNVDKNGKKTSDATNKVVIEMNIDPDEGNPLLYTMETQTNTWSKPYNLSFKLTKKSDIAVNGEKVQSLNISKKYTKRETDADKLKIKTYKNKSDNISMKYGLYVPKGEVENVFVYLHGTGEGGGNQKNTDPYVTALANEVTNELGDEFQNTVGKSAVLVPQSPTIWQDATGNNCKWENGLPVIEGPSIYRDALMNLIKETKEETGAKHVIIAGGSGGGYMTMAMLCAYPDQFDAAVPICEAYPMEMVSDTDIEAIKDIPMFFIYSKDDTSVDNDKFENPLINKLKAAGAKKIEVFNPDHVVDTSNTYNYLNDNQQYQYNGHWAWIYFHNNEAVGENGEKVWEWIANQVK